MQCGRNGCGNMHRGRGNFKLVTVKDERSTRPSEYKENWCSECVGNFQPHKYYLVYYSENNKLRMKRVPRPVGEQTVEESLSDVLAPVVEDKPSTPVNRADVGAIKRARAARKQVSKPGNLAPIEG